MGTNHRRRKLCIRHHAWRFSIHGVPSATPERFRRRLRQAARAVFAGSLVALASMLPAAAGACGAQGGDEGGQAKELVCDPGAPVASHPGVDPPAATRNPIDPVTGNKYLHQRDAVFAGGLMLARHYNSRNDFPSSLGPGWRHGFEVVLAVGRQHGKRRAQIIQGDGRRIVFEAGRSPRHFLALEPGYGDLVHHPDGPPDRQYLWRWRNGSRLSFDHLGRLSWVDHADGRQFRLNYGAHACQLASVSTPAAVTLRFSYVDDGCRVTGVTLPDGTRISYRYDTLGLLRSVERAGEPAWEFDYDDRHRAALVRMRDGQGRTRGEFAYGPQGRAIASALENGREAVTLTYRLAQDAGGIGETRIRDLGGHETIVRWRLDVRTQVRQLLSIDGERCVACPATGWRWAYDRAGRLIESAHKASGTVVPLRRDHLGRVIEKRVSQREMSRHWWYTYSGSGSGPRAGPHVDRTDESSARLTAIETDSVAPGKRHRLRLHYDSLGRLSEVVESGWQPDMLSLKGEAPNWRFERFSPIERTRSVVYGARGPSAGRITEVRLNGRRMHGYEYGAHGHLVARTDASGLQWRYRYDAQARLTRIQRPDGSEWKAGWSANGLTVTDHGVVTEIGLAADGLPDAVLPSNAPAMWFERNPRGEITSVRVHGGHTLDLRARNAILVRAPVETTVASPDGTGVGPHIDAETGSRPGARTVNLKPAGDAALQASAIITIARPDLGERAYWVVDDFGRSLAQLDPVLGVRRWAYDDQDQVVAYADNHGIAQHILRDPDGRPLRVESAQRRPLLSLGYDKGRLVSRTNPTQAERLGYDEQGRPNTREIHLRDPASGQHVGPIRIDQHFDAQGRLERRSLPDGFVLRYRWRADNTLAGIDLLEPSGRSQMLLTDCRWLPFAGGQSGLLAARFGNGTQMLRRIDAGLRTLAVRHSPAPGRNEPIPTIERRLDASGRTIAWRQGGNLHTVSYDMQGRIIEDGNEHWAYDRNGSPIANPDAKPPHTHKPPATPRALWTDASGMLRIALNSGAGGNNTLGPVRYLRNASSERIAKLWPAAPQATQWFVNEARRPQMMLDAQGRLRRLFVYVDHLPVAVIDIHAGGANVSWIHADYRGLPRALTDDQGRLRWSGEYGAFGDLIGARWHGPPMQGFGIETDHGLPSPVPMRLPGQYHDAETGLHHNDLRTFDPQAARYLSPDPLGLRTTGLRYAYAENQPYDRADPLGLYEIDIHYYMTYFIARTAGIEHNAAYRIALAAQGIDDNPLTQPINVNAQGETELIATATGNQERLLAYHFVLSERETTYVPPLQYAMGLGLPQGPRVGMVPGPNGSIGIQTVRNPPSDIALANPSSPQLDRLMNAALSGTNPCAQAHLLGEFVHAFQDTYSHRDHENRPYDPVVDFLSLGLGHLRHMHDPDWTFNHINSIRPQPVMLPTGIGVIPRYDTPDGSPRFSYVDWNVNEDRTLQMERDLHALLSKFGNPRDAVPFEMIEDTLREFNATQEWQRHGQADAISFPRKLALVEEELRLLGYQVESDSVRFLSRGNSDATVPYVREDAEANRTQAVCSMTSTVGTIPDKCSK